MSDTCEDCGVLLTNDADAHPDIPELCHECGQLDADSDPDSHLYGEEMWGE